MATFQDAAGRVWHLRVTVGTLRRVRSLLGLDLLDGDLVPRLSADPSALVDVLYCVLKPQADEAGISDEAFAEQLAGDAIDHATEALLAALVDFLPESRRRLLVKARDKFRETQAATLRQAEAMLDAIDPEKLARQAAAQFSASASSTPASSASTPNT